MGDLIFGKWFESLDSSCADQAPLVGVLGVILGSYSSETTASRDARKARLCFSGLLVSVGMTLKGQKVSSVSALSF